MSKPTANWILVFLVALLAAAVLPLVVALWAMTLHLMRTL